MEVHGFHQLPRKSFLEWQDSIDHLWGLRWDHWQLFRKRSNNGIYGTAPKKPVRPAVPYGAEKVSYFSCPAKKPPYCPPWADRRRPLQPRWEDNYSAAQHTTTTTTTTPAKGKLAKQPPPKTPQKGAYWTSECKADSSKSSSTRIVQDRNNKPIRQTVRFQTPIPSDEANFIKLPKQGQPLSSKQILLSKNLGDNLKPSPRVKYNSHQIECGREKIPLFSGVCASSHTDSLMNLIKKQTESYVKQLQSHSISSFVEHSISKPPKTGCRYSGFMSYKPANIGECTYGDWLRKQQQRKKTSKNANNVAFGRSCCNNVQRWKTTPEPIDLLTVKPAVKYSLRRIKNARWEVFNSINEYRINTQAREDLEKQAGEFEKEKKARPRKSNAGNKVANSPKDGGVTGRGQRFKGI